MTGVVIAQRADRWWAWAASHVMPAGPPPADPPEPLVAAPTTAPATVHNEQSGPADNVVQVGQLYGGLHLYEGRRADAPPDDSAWLRSCWAAVAAADAAVELRYLTGSDTPSLAGFLVVRTEGTARAETQRRAVAVRTQLGVLPGHAAATPVLDETETHQVLQPFRPHTEGILEVRKRLTVHRTHRDDVDRPWLTSVRPLTNQRQPWDELWAELAKLPFRALLSVGLAPYPVRDGLRTHLAARAAELGRLARQGPAPTPVWNIPRPPDEFAGAALTLISDAVRRYTDRAFLIRISIAAERPLPSLLAELVAETISAGTPPVVVRPDPAEVATAWHNITTLNFAPLAAYAQGHPAAAIGDLERVLSAIVDLDEAAAAFRLPYLGTGRPSPFRAH